MTRSAVETRGGRAIVDVVGARDSCPSIDTNARKRSQRVDTSRAVSTHVGSYRALVHIAGTVGARPLRGTLTRVCIDLISTSGAVLAEISSAVIDIVFAMKTRESLRTLTAIGQGLVVWDTMATIKTSVVLTRDVSLVAMLSCKAFITIAFKSSKSVDTNAILGTYVLHVTLVHVLSTVLTGETIQTLALIAL